MELLLTLRRNTCSAVLRVRLLLSVPNAVVLASTVTQQLSTARGAATGHRAVPVSMVCGGSADGEGDMQTATAERWPRAKENGTKATSGPGTARWRWQGGLSAGCGSSVYRICGTAVLEPKATATTTDEEGTLELKRKPGGPKAS